jgi:hypothetical protein
VAAAATLVFLLFGAALVTAGARGSALARMRAGAPAVKRWGGYVLLLVGVWFVALGAWADAFSGLFAV